jgi:hypothetical protein
MHARVKAPRRSIWVIEAGSALHLVFVHGNPAALAGLFSLLNWLPFETAEEGFIGSQPDEPRRRVPQRH